VQNIIISAHRAVFVLLKQIDRLQELGGHLREAPEEDHPCVSPVEVGEHQLEPSRRKVDTHRYLQR
jgi:hypothetical protein